MLAAQAAGGSTFDLAILDLQMPEMDGLQLAAAIKAEATTTALPLVILTSLGQRGHAAAAEAAGVAGYLTKPVREGHLKRCLAMVLSGAAKTDDRVSDPARNQRRLVTRHTLIEGRSHAQARILLAEDNVVNQRIAVKMLEKLGCRVDVAINGQRALEAIEATRYDLVLMDCQMPVMDGFEATRALRIREGDERRTPIVAMTANAMAGDRERCLEAGMDGYLTKPVRPDELTAAVSRWLPLIEASDESEAATVGAPATAPHESAPLSHPDLELIVLDRAQLDELQSVAGPDDGAFIAELIAIFLTEGDEEVQRIRTAVETGDAGEVMLAAHRLKGSALNLGCTSLAEAADRLETLGRSKALGDAGPVVDRLAAAFDRTATALRIELDAA
jgi:two-component system sensor histidine kinase/response regulator